jgi:site-specific recombinase XerD
MTTTLEIKEMTYNEHGFKYTGLQVTGYVNGERVRFRARDKAHAQMIMIREQTKAVNAERALEYMPTTLSREQLQECEVGVEKLGKRIKVSEVFEFWHKHHGARIDMTLSKAIDLYVEHQSSRVREVTLKQSRSWLKRFEAFCGSEQAINEITHGVIQSYLDSLKGKKDENGVVAAASNKYWNNTRQVLHAFFAWTTERPQEFTAHNPVSDIKAKRREEKDIETISADQAEALMRHVENVENGKHARFFALALFAGIRPEGEMKKLEERDIDLANGVIKIRKEVSKTKRSRQITISENLRTWLVKFAAQPLNDITVRQLNVIRNKYSPGHDILRHTFCSNHLCVSSSFADTALEAGNSEKILRDHYVNRTTKPEAAKFWAITAI